MSPDPAFLYESQQHSAALTMLEYAMESQASFCLLTGEIGSGKTTVMRRLIRMLGGEVTVGLISNTHGRFRSIHPWALSALRITARDTSEIAQYEALTDFFIAEYGRGRRVLLILDEAQNLTVQTLEELRLLSNVNSEKHVALQIILVGQPELRVKMAQPELRQFAQRVAVDFHLNALTLPDAEAYVRHRLTVAGGSSEIFRRDAIEFIHEHSGGIPRLMNQLCDLSLVYAFAEGLHQIDAGLVAEVSSDRDEARVSPPPVVIDLDDGRAASPAADEAAPPRNAGLVRSLGSDRADRTPSITALVADPGWAPDPPPMAARSSVPPPTAAPSRPRAVAAAGSRSTAVSADSAAPLAALVTPVSAIPTLDVTPLAAVTKKPKAAPAAIERTAGRRSSKPPSPSLQTARRAAPKRSSARGFWISALVLLVLAGVGGAIAAAYRWHAGSAVQLRAPATNPPAAPPVAAAAARSNDNVAAATVAPASAGTPAPSHLPVVEGSNAASAASSNAPVPVLRPLRNAAAAMADNDNCPYPREAVDQGLTGTVSLLIYVSPDGKPTTIKMDKSSGTDVLDQAAVMCVEKFARFPSPPAGTTSGAYWGRMRFKWSFGA